MPLPTIEYGEPGVRFVSIRVAPSFKEQLELEAELAHRSLQNEVIEMLKETLRRRSLRRSRQTSAA